jgi:hypothetical protein
VHTGGCGHDRHSKFEIPLALLLDKEVLTMLDINAVEPGNRKSTETSWDHPSFFEMIEIVKIKTDTDKFTLCYHYGNPYEPKECARCHIAAYCSRDSQAVDYPKHKKTCKTTDKKNYEDSI